MTQWRKTVNIKPLLTDDLNDTVAMQNIRDLLSGHSEFANVLGDMDDAIHLCDGNLFNAALDRAYNIADYARIWMGP